MLQRLKTIISRIVPWTVKRFVYRFLAVRYITSLKRPSDRTKKTLVILNHFFDQDVRALNLSNERFNLVVIDTVTLFRGAKIFFDRDIRELHSPYDHADKKFVALYRKECQLYFNHLKEQTGCDLIVTASDIFYWIREFIAIAREQSVETVVLDKEGTLSPHDFVAEAERIAKSAPFISSHIYVWSERQKEFWTRIGAKKEQISIIGQPRSDLLHKERRNEVDRYFPKKQPIITLFSYMDDAYIPVELIVAEKLTWEMKKPTHEEIHRLASLHTEYNFVVKTHPQQPDLQQLQSEYDRENLKVIGGSAIANELLQRSELIIAFQTTAIIEGMFLGKNIIYTYWDKLIERLQGDLLPFHEAEGIRIVRSFPEFKSLCSRFLNGDRSDFEFTAKQKAERDRFVNRYLYKPDGQVCKRFFSHVEKMLA